MPLTDETRVAAREIVARYPRPRSALLPLLHLVQSEQGHVTPQGQAFCAEILGLTRAEDVSRRVKAALIYLSQRHPGEPSDA